MSKRKKLTQRVSRKINEQPIEQVKYTKYLGFDDDDDGGGGGGGGGGNITLTKLQLKY